MSEPDPGMLQWLWSVLLLPITWLWARIGKADDRTDELRLRVAADEVAAAHFLSRAEVQDVVDRSLLPLRDDLSQIRLSQREIFEELKRQRRGES